MDLNDLHRQLPTIKLHFEQTLGYDRVHSLMLIAGLEGEPQVSIYCRDEFQADLSYEHRVRNGVLSFDCDSLGELWAKIHALPDRRERELRVMLTQVGHAIQHRDTLIDPEARAFAEALVAKHQQYAGLLTDMRASAAT